MAHCNLSDKSPHVIHLPSPCLSRSRARTTALQAASRRSSMSSRAFANIDLWGRSIFRKTFLRCLARALSKYSFTRFGGFARDNHSMLSNKTCLTRQPPRAASVLPNTVEYPNAQTQPCHHQKHRASNPSGTRRCSCLQHGNESFPFYPALRILCDEIQIQADRLGTRFGSMV
jgi:hypothetical protein